VLTRWRAVVIITIAYLAVVAGARMLFGYISFDDNRDEQSTMIFASVMIGLWLFSMVKISRGSRARR
jgi:hypothetical protein